MKRSLLLHFQNELPNLSRIGKSVIWLINIRRFSSLTENRANCFQISALRLKHVAANPTLFAAVSVVVTPVTRAAKKATVQGFCLLTHVVAQSFSSG